MRRTVIFRLLLSSCLSTFRALLVSQLVQSVPVRPSSACVPCSAVCFGLLGLSATAFAAESPGLSAGGGRGGSPSAGAGAGAGAGSGSPQELGVPGARGAPDPLLEALGFGGHSFLGCPYWSRSMGMSSVGMSGCSSGGMSSPRWGARSAVVSSACAGT